MILAAGATLLVQTTAYCLGHKTATGTRPEARRTIAADWNVLKPGTPVNIVGLGPRIVEDNGPRVVGYHVDVFTDSCNTALNWGAPDRRLIVMKRPVSAREWDETRAAIASDRLDRLVDAQEPPGREIAREGASLPLRLWIGAWLTVAAGLLTAAVCLLWAARRT